MVWGVGAEKKISFLVFENNYKFPRKISHKTFHLEIIQFITE